MSHEEYDERGNRQETVRLNERQFTALMNAVEKGFEGIQKWQSIQNETIQQGFDKVAEAILKTNAPPPEPQTGGIIMARFKVAADNPDFEIQLTASGFTDAEGNPTGAGDIDLAVDNSNAGAIEGTLGPQTLSEDGQSVSATVSAHVGAPSADLGVIAYKAVNRDTGAVVAAGSDEFIVGAGEASVGTVTSTVPLTPEP